MVNLREGDIVGLERALERWRTHGDNEDAREGYVEIFTRCLRDGTALTSDQRERIAMALDRDREFASRTPRMTGSFRRMAAALAALFAPASARGRDNL